MPNFSEGTPFISSLIIILQSEEVATKIIDEFSALGISCKRYYKPLEPLKHATDLYNRIVCFPCHLDMELSTVDEIIERINKIC